MTDPALPLGWDSEPGAVDFGFHGFCILMVWFFGPCIVTGWAAWRLSKIARRYRGTR